MGRFGWYLAGALLAALIVYAFRPEAAADGPLPVVTLAKNPDSYSVTAGGLDQTVTGTAVQLHGLTRTVNEEKANALWGAVRSLRGDPRKKVAGIGVTQTGAYGLDATRQITAPGTPALALRWGVKDGSAYAWDGQATTLYVVDPAVVAQLDKAAGERLDKPDLVDLSGPSEPLTVDGLVLGRQGADWKAPGAPERPAFSDRAERLLTLVRAEKLTSFAEIPGLALAPVLGSVTIGPPGPKQVALTLRSAADQQGVLEVRGLPPQRLDAPTTASWRTALQAFKRNPLVAVDRQLGGRDKISQILGQSAGQQPWRLERRDKTGDADAAAWDLVWPGGRENAGEDVLNRIVDALDHLDVLDPVADPKALDAAPPSALRITLVHGRDQARFTVALDPGYAASPSHRGRLEDPAATIARFAPQRFLDDRLTRRAGDRVCKIQRRILDQTVPQEEVLARGDSGAWRRTWPKGPETAVDAGAIDRLVRVLVHARVQDLALVGLGTPPAKAKELLAAPDLELAVRFAAVVKGRAANDETDLDETAPQDWGLALKRIDQRWWGTDLEGNLVFTLDDDTVAEFRQSLSDGQLFPVVAAVVTKATITTFATPGGKPEDKVETTLERNGSRWTVRTGDQPAKPASDTEVRRWFRDLGKVRVAKLDAGAAELTPLETTATIAVEVPALGGKGSETLTLGFGTPTGDAGARTVPVHTASNQPLSRFPRGRAAIDPALLPGLLPTAATLAAP